MALEGRWPNWHGLYIPDVDDPKLEGSKNGLWYRVSVLIPQVGVRALTRDIPVRGRRWSSGDRSERRCGRCRATGSTSLAAIDKLTATDFLEQIGKLDPDWHHIEGAQQLQPLVVERAARTFAEAPAIRACA
jgi:hypothetical protein